MNKKPNWGCLYETYILYVVYIAYMDSFLISSFLLPF